MCYHSLMGDLIWREVVSEVKKERALAFILPFFCEEYTVWW